jgi:hypothetical protein
MGSALKVGIVEGLHDSGTKVRLEEILARFAILHFMIKSKHRPNFILGNPDTLPSQDGDATEVLTVRGIPQEIQTMKIDSHLGLPCASVPMLDESKPRFRHSGKM